MPRKATIGPEIYARVNALVGEGKTRTEAFAAVAQERDQRAGTVAANYYRIARAQGTTGARRQRRSRSNASTRRTPQTRRLASTAGKRGSQPAAGHAEGDLEALAKQIATLTTQLVQQVAARDAQLRELIG